MIHPESGLKIDLIVTLPGSPDHARLGRACVLPIEGGGHARFTSPEDSIVSKLDFFRQGESEKHLRDIASILKIRGDKLDLAYVSSWASTELLRRTGRS